jgi:hypothetical protein
MEYMRDTADMMLHHRTTAQNFAFSPKKPIPPTLVLATSAGRFAALPLELNEGGARRVGHRGAPKAPLRAILPISQPISRKKGLLVRDGGDNLWHVRAKQQSA